MKFNLNNPELFSEQIKEYFFELLKAFIHQDYTYQASSEVFQERFDICKSCQYFDPEKLKCIECGCNLITKMTDSLESCPIDKWSIDKEGFMKKHYSEIASALPVGYGSFEFISTDCDGNVDE